MIPKSVAFPIAAVAEIGGCYAIWGVVRFGRSPFWLLPGLICLLGFGTVLALGDGSAAGRSYAAYGGVYVCASILWLSSIEGIALLRTDVLGGVLCLLGCAVIVAGAQRS